MKVHQCKDSIRGTRMSFKMNSAMKNRVSPLLTNTSRKCVTGSAISQRRSRGSNRKTIKWVKWCRRGNRFCWTNGRTRLGQIKVYWGREMKLSKRDSRYKSILRWAKTLRLKEATLSISSSASRLRTFLRARSSGASSQLKPSSWRWPETSRRQKPSDNSEATSNKASSWILNCAS